MIPTFVAVFALTAISLVKAQDEDVRSIVGTWILSWFRRVTRKWWLSLLLVAAGSLTAEASPFAYVANFSSGTVSVIDIATNTVVATVPVGTGTQGVAITADGAFAYVANSLPGFHAWHRLGDRHCEQYRGGYGAGGDYPSRCGHHPNPNRFGERAQKEKKVAIPYA
jgi:YVTN family beta-propeller protein